MKRNREFWDKARVGEEHDGRRKLTNEERADIKARHEKGEPIRQIAKSYEGKCSRRTIQFVCYPEKLKALNAKRKPRKVDPDKNRAAQRRHRNKLKRLHKQGKISV